MQKQTVEHIRRLSVNEGGSYELSSVSRNMNRFFDLFLSGSMLCEGCKAVFFYADDLENPFYEQTFSETTHTNNNDWICSISRWDLRREGFKGEFQILIRIFAVDDSEICKIFVPIKGKRAVKCKSRAW